MSRARTWVVLALGWCLIAAGLASPASAGPPPDRMAAIQTEVDAMVAAGVPGVVYLVRDGSRTQVITAGLGDIRKGTPIRADDRFRIASITKSFVAVTILKLVEAPGCAMRPGTEVATTASLPRLSSTRLPSTIPGTASRLTPSRTPAPA